MTIRSNHRSSRAAAALFLAAFVATPGAARASTVTIVNQDGPGEGFNDPTSRAPIGGNSGTTLGQQRLIVFQTAANIWGSILPSNVVIRVQAQFNPLACDTNGAVLGSAGPVTVIANFSGAPLTNHWYHIALANRLAGSDLDPTRNDISAQFNLSLDDNTCLGTSGWYYGLDHNEGSDIDLLAVVLHEIGHGLGFSTLISASTGQLLNGKPDAFSHFILDNGTGLTWDQMTSGQRAASAVNTGHLVWSGAAVTNESSIFLGPKPIVRVNSPPAIAGDLAFGTASFGPALSQPGVTGGVVLVNDGVGTTTDACSAIVNAAQVSGHIALVDRGTCTFVSKAQAAQAAGAIGVVIANNVSGSPPAMGGDDPGITIPVVSITQQDGTNIKNQLGSGVSMTLGVDPNQHAGADAANRVQLYAPNPVESGSSVSHWDVSAFPDLLLEPFITPDLTNSVDLTRYAFQDLGWYTPTTSVGPTGVTALRLASSPNPFGHATAIRFDLPGREPVELSVLDPSGRRVRRLYRGTLDGGAHTATWDGEDEAGRRVAAGVYLSYLKAGALSRTQRLVLLK